MPKITFNLSQNEFNELKKLSEDGTYIDTSDACRTIYRAGWNKLYPAYVKNLEYSNKRANRSLEEKAKEKLELIETKDKLKEENVIVRGRQICEMLGGKVIMSDGGFPHCEYKMYTEEGGGRVEETVMVEPLDMLNEGHLYDQFRDIEWNKGEKVKEKLLKLIEGQNGK